MSLTLNDLLEDLEKSAGLKKEAEGKDYEEYEKKEDEVNASVKENISEAKKALEDAGKDVEEAEKINDEEKKELAKEARLQGAALAQEVMSKVAALQLKTDTNKEPEMKKEAAEAGKALAEALLQKLASAGDVSTDNGVTLGTVPNKNIVDNAQMVAEQDATIKPLPTGDGIRNHGTINQILDAIVADAIAQGATPHGQGVEAKAHDAEVVEGAVEESAVPNQVDNDEVEKAAAVSALVADGYDFATAVELVKAAEEEIAREEDVQIKQAALGALLDRGVDFDVAVQMVKEANALVRSNVLTRGLAQARGAAMKAVEKINSTAAGRRLMSDAKDLPAQIRSMKVAPRMAGAGLARNRVAQIGAGVAAAGTGAAGVASLNREKKAAFDALFDSGLNFEDAAALVSAKAAEIYGE